MNPPNCSLRVGEGAVLYAPLSFLKSYGGRCLRCFQWIAAEIDVGLDESLVVSPPSTDVGGGFVVVACSQNLPGIRTLAGRIASRFLCEQF
jgi:hypothetical protein